MRRIDFYTDQYSTAGSLLLRGAARYGQLHGAWEIRPLPVDAEWTRRNLLGSTCDGMLLKNPPAGLFDGLEHPPRPAVQIHGDLTHPRIPRLAIDNVRAGQLGAAHLRGRAYTRLAFCGADMWWSYERCAGFEAACPGTTVTTNRGDDGRFPPWRWLHDDDAVRRWLERLVPPVGVMGCSDDFAARLIEVARSAGLRVPEDVAVLGVNNDERLCEYGPLQISSVDPDVERIGYTAAATLDRLLRGDRVGPDPPRVPPRGVVQRRSTSALAVDDPDLVEAVRLIRERACDGITVGDVVRHVNLSRRTLERRFKQVFGLLPGDEIRAHRLRRARDLLQDTHLSLTNVAHRSGYFDSAHFCREFKKAAGQTPTQYRRGRATLGVATPGTA